MSYLYSNIENIRGMKKKQLLFVLMVGLVVFGGCATTQSGKESKELTETRVKESVDNRAFRISVDRVVPMSGRSRNVTSNYSLTVRNDSVFSYLPYFGQAYSLPYGGGVGMTFDAPLTEYSQRYDKKNNAEITFRTRSADDTHTFRIQIYPNASATIQVTSINRQGITYYGTVDLKEGE